MEMRALELFCGIGGFAFAAAELPLRVAGAFDQSPAALSVYRLNFPDHPARLINLENVSARELTACGAGLWWMSPPCQPYTLRGVRRDLEDPRATSLIRIMDVLEEIPSSALPFDLALENVSGFADSEARKRLLDLLRRRGYLLQEHFLCPTQLGIPSRRPRYYLTASRRGLHALRLTAAQPMRPLSAYVDVKTEADSLLDLGVPAGVLAKFGPGLRILDGGDPAAYTTCFTSGYGRSVMHAGSYLRCNGGVRRFSPEEIIRLLHFPRGFRFPGGMTTRKRWQLAGNSLSVAAVREILKAFPDLDPGP